MAERRYRTTDIFYEPTSLAIKSCCHHVIELAKATERGTKDYSLEILEANIQLLKLRLMTDPFPTPQAQTRAYLTIENLQRQLDELTRPRRRGFQSQTECRNQ